MATTCSGHIGSSASRESATRRRSLVILPCAGGSPRGIGIVWMTRVSYDRAPRIAGAWGAHIGLFWRLLIPNAAVLRAASVVLIVAPPNGRVVGFLTGLVSMLAI